MNDFAGKRGRAWFHALTGQSRPMKGDPASVLVADADLGGNRARFLCVVPNPGGRFPCARHGEVGLEEAWTLAARVHEITRPNGSGAKQPIVALVDLKSQAYGRREEIAAIYLAAAGAADAYGTARLAGHPVISLVVGQALSGGFLTHGYQANRILAFDDAGVMIHAMHKAAAARVTRRSVKDLEALASKIAPMSYDIRDFAKLGLLHKLLHPTNPDLPTREDVAMVQAELIAAIEDARATPVDLRNRRESKEAEATRRASRLVYQKLSEQWHGPSGKI